MYSIYKIEHRTNPDLVYVGSTKDFKGRKSDHKCQSQTSNLKVYQMIRENGGWEQFDMIELNQVEGTQLEARQEEERDRIELNASLNSNRAFRDKKVYQKEYREQNQEHIKQYLEENRNHILEQMKQYRKNHQEEIKQKKQEHYQAHREERLQKNKEPYTCECGSQITRSVKARHLRSQKHIEWASI